MGIKIYLLLVTFGLPSKETQNSASMNRAWLVKDVSFPEGIYFRARHKGRDYTAKVKDGALDLDERKFLAPSAATMYITGVSTNSWIFWECKQPGKTHFKTMKEYRPKH